MLKDTALLPWQQQQWNNLQQRIAADKLPHALLLQGQQGLGKFHFAQRLAQYLLCDNADKAACGQCQACHLLHAETHPDFYVIDPDSETIKVDTIRELVAFLQQTPLKAAYKVVIIRQAHRMNRAASNAVLKTLEEPSGQGVLLLSTDQPGRLLATIRSRCQMVKFSAPSRESAIKWLHETTQNTEHDWPLLLSLAADAPLLAQAYADETWLDQRRNLFQAFKAVSQQQMSVVDCSEAWSKLDLRWVLHILQTWLMDMIRLKSVDTSNTINNTDLKNDLQFLSRHIDSRQLFLYVDKLVEKNHLLVSGVNLNQQLLIEALLIDWCDTLN